MDIGNLLRLPLAPTNALRALFLSTDLKSAMILVLLAAIAYSIIGVSVTAEMSDVIGIERVNALEATALAILELIVALVSFLMFSVISAMVASKLFGGRGDKESTAALLGCCYPWFVVVSVTILLIFVGGFSGLELSHVEQWTDNEMDDAIVWGIALLIAAVVGLVWALSRRK